MVQRSGTGYVKLKTRTLAPEAQPGARFDAVRVALLWWSRALIRQHLVQSCGAKVRLQPCVARCGSVKNVFLATRTMWILKLTTRSHS